jgi:hypothetical protein
MTATFQIVRPTRAQDKIWDAVSEAVCAGMTVKEFIQEAREAWADELRSAAKDAEFEFQKGLK